MKDFIVKFKTMEGYDSPYVPGWDATGCRSSSSR
ncbi:MAG: class I tRNA ligase family protein [Acidobacteriota bacterium]